MRIKTMIIIIIIVLLTVVIMQNTDDVPFKFLFAKFYISKLVLMLAVAFIGLVIGVLLVKPGKPRYIPGNVEGADATKKQIDTLSDEDRDYIS
jgi:uncharacterized membrane protein YciS (DUF1049 family)